MSDDISIPRPALSGATQGPNSFTHSYRSRRTGMDRNTKVLLAAAALSAVLVGGMAVWHFSGHRTGGGVPTIEADTRPVRVKPDNPGGMTAIGVSDPAAGGHRRGGNAPATAPAVPAPSANTAARPVASGAMVQLAALDSESAATGEWQRLAHKLPDLFGDRQPVVQRTEQGGKTFWRLRTGGFGDIADATQFCKRARAKGVSCSLANF